jgi:BirA family biotin operon repressor/biotin-[acetyl-CoA-carboxylase] ligase
LSSSAERERPPLPRPAGSYDGVPVPRLAERWGVPRLLAFDSIGSTLDVAHAVASDTPTGTLVLADEQTAGRGQHGRRWSSAPGAGVWLTLVERPSDARALEVLALRCGLFAAEALDTFVGAPVGLKWPNDLHVDGRKLAGILIETRWRGTAPEWVAIGFGLNVAAPALDGAIGLPAGATRLAVLDALVPALRRAAASSRHLSEAELARWRTRDIAAGRQLETPARGRAAGISADGLLLIAGPPPDGAITAHRSGSLTFAEPPQCS